METYLAPKLHVYFHKDKPKLYGEAVVIREEDDYTIDDFVIINKEEFMLRLKEDKNIVPEEGK